MQNYVENVEESTKCDKSLVKYDPCGKAEKLGYSSTNKTRI